MKIQQYIVGPVQTNCYFAINDKTKECLVIDPGAAPQQLADKISEQNLIPRAILLTHAHADHANGAAPLQKLLAAMVRDEDHANCSDSELIPIIASRAEQVTMDDPEINLSAMIAGRAQKYHADQLVRDEEELTIAGMKLRALCTPGHTPGGCCYYFPYEDIVFTGDSLFAGSIGRTDFPGGSMSDLVRTVKEKLLALPDHTQVMTGHNELTTIGDERMYNPYLAG